MVWQHPPFALVIVMAIVYDQALEKDLLRATLILVKMNQWVLPFLRLGTITSVVSVFSLDAARLSRWAFAHLQKQSYCTLRQQSFRQPIHVVPSLQFDYEQGRLASTPTRSLKHGRERIMTRFSNARSWNNQGFLTSTPSTFHPFVRVFVQLPLQQESGA